jgi:hypothetical protein
MISRPHHPRRSVRSRTALSNVSTARFSTNPSASKASAHGSRPLMRCRKCWTNISSSTTLSAPNHERGMNDRSPATVCKAGLPKPKLEKKEKSTPAENRTPPPSLSHQGVASVRRLPLLYTLPLLWHQRFEQDSFGICRIACMVKSIAHILFASDLAQGMATSFKTAIRRELRPAKSSRLSNHIFSVRF